MSATPTAWPELAGTRLEPCPGDALVVVDVQRDFLPGGALGVPEGDRVVAPLNRCSALFEQLHLPIVLTRDWHPADHCSFYPQGGPWPPHCVADSAGAGFAPGLVVADDAHIVSKATRSDADAYSGFQHTGLADWLRDRGCRRLFIGGLATDYCVLATVRDARNQGFDVVALRDAMRAVDVQPGDGERAQGAMVAAGALLASVDEVAGASA